MEEVRKYIDRRSFQNDSRVQETERIKPPKKEGKSPFDEMLEQGRRLQQGAVDTQVKTRQAGKEAVKATEKFKQQTKERSRENDDKEEIKQEAKEERKDSQSVGKKVVGKGKLKKDHSGTGGRGQGEGHAFAKEGKRHVLNTTKQGMGDVRLQVHSHEFAQLFQQKLTREQSALPKSLPQEVLNNIIRHVRVGLSEKGTQEVELDLHRNIFKGLRLRISSNRGKVNVHFLTANGGVRELFTREKSTIQSSLEKKGIAVEEIRVT